MPETLRPPPELIYKSDRSAIYLGNCGRGLSQIFELYQPTVVLSDPPYAFWSHIKRVVSGQLPYDRTRDVEWMIDVDMWMQQWFVALRTLMQGPDTVAWFFQHPHYFTFMMRWATWTRWAMQLVVQMPVQLPGIAATQMELLVRYSDDVTFGSADGLRVKQAIELNAYGSVSSLGKSVEMLQLLLQASPSGCVFDPFCGTGSTLEAALREGRTCVGVEIDDETAAQAVARIRAIEAELGQPAALTG